MASASLSSLILLLFLFVNIVLSSAVLANEQLLPKYVLRRAKQLRLKNKSLQNNIDDAAVNPFSNVTSSPSSFASSFPLPLSPSHNDKDNNRNDNEGVCGQDGVPCTSFLALPTLDPRTVFVTQLTTSVSTVYRTNVINFVSTVFEITTITSFTAITTTVLSLTKTTRTTSFVGTITETFFLTRFIFSDVTEVSDLTRNFPAVVLTCTQTNTLIITFTTISRTTETRTTFIFTTSTSVSTNFSTTTSFTTSAMFIPVISTTTLTIFSSVASTTLLTTTTFTFDPSVIIESTIVTFDFSITFTNRETVSETLTGPGDISSLLVSETISLDQVTFLTSGTSFTVTTTVATETLLID